MTVSSVSLTQNFSKQLWAITDLSDASFVEARGYLERIDGGDSLTPYELDELEKYYENLEEVRCKREELLGAIGSEAIPALIPILENGDTWEKIRVIDAFSWMHKDAGTTRPYLQLALKDPDRNVSARARHALEKLMLINSPPAPDLTRIAINNLR